MHFIILMFLSAEEFHNVHVIGDSPACYMYIYENTTHKEIVEGMKAIETKIEEQNITDYTANLTLNRMKFAVGLSGGLGVKLKSTHFLFIRKGQIIR